jgi:hypothetical protein
MGNSQSKRWTSKCVSGKAMRSKISELAANPGMQYTEILLVSIIENTLLQGKNKDINQKN